MTAQAGQVGGPAWPGVSGTPLIASRSLGRLVGLETLLFKVECWQPTGSWLDRSAAAIVEAAVAEGRAGLCVLGIEPWTVPLAVCCARAGLRCVVLESVERDREAAEEGGWLTALGARTVAVMADGESLRRWAPVAADSAGLHLVLSGDPLLQSGLASAIQEVERAGYADAVLALPSVTGGEHGWLAETALMRRRVAVLGRLTEDIATSTSSTDSFVLVNDISPREADAARRLLAREEGLLVSRRGAAGFAGLVRALRDDRAKRPRERRLRDAASAVVVLTGDPLRAGDGPPVPADAVAARPISLAELSSGLSRLLVEPPGRQAGEGTVT
ncbi:MAG TPA: pyridoxal-phosphate dependent enzyme [Chloroflexota bacterium]|nr:pyridoxal-phosphate dependent enzyme [Chloroflexota bacterium]